MIALTPHFSATVPTQYSWWCDESSGGGALGALGSHMIDALFYLTKLRARSVMGVTRTYVETTPKMDGFRHITSGMFGRLRGLLHSLR